MRWYQSLQKPFLRRRLPNSLPGTLEQLSPNERREKSVRLHQERVERYHQIQDLYAKKVDPANIARQVGISRQSVYAYLKMKEPPARTRIHRQYKPLIDPYKEYLVKRWNEGCRNAQLVYREIKEQGYTGSDQPIARFFAQFRQKKERRKFKQVDPSNETAIKTVPKRPPTASKARSLDHI